MTPEPTITIGIICTPEQLADVEACGLRVGAVDR
jgi:hypothetical protein